MTVRFALDPSQIWTRISTLMFDVCQLLWSSSDADGMPAVPALHIGSPFRDAAGPSSSGPRAEGKRLVAVPQGAPPPLEGCRQFPERKMETVGEIDHIFTGLLSACDLLLCPAL